jgi:hypothetical protein
MKKNTSCGKSRGADRNKPSISSKSDGMTGNEMSGTTQSAASNNKPATRSKVTLRVWKWADNDAPGSIMDVVRDVYSGEAPLVLAEFDAHAVADAMISKVYSLNGPSGLILVAPETVRFNGRPIALALSLAGTITDDVIEQVAQVATAMGLTVLHQETSHLVGDSHPKHHMQRLQHQPDALDPTWEMVTQRLGRLDAAKANPYLILENSIGNYVQVYACDGNYAVEWHERGVEGPKRTQFKHWCAGHEPLKPVLVNHGTREYHITVFESELLTLDEATEILRSFYQGEGRPEGYGWRDMTDEIEALR